MIDPNIISVSATFNFLRCS